MQCACSVFDGSYKSRHSRGRLLSEAKDSLEAEIEGATLALQTALAILNEEFESKKAKNKKSRREADPTAPTAIIESFLFKGDSMVIYNAVSTGDFLRFDGKQSLSKQSAAWTRFKNSYDKLQNLGYPIHWEWVPRMMNREADELCNAALDKRPPNPDIRSEPSPCPVETKSLMEAVLAISKRKRRTPSRLPDQLSRIWASFIFDVLGSYHKDPIRARLLFLIAPHLINLGMFPYVQGRADFRAYRRHLHSLTDDTYLNEQLRVLMDQLKGDLVPTDPPKASSRSAEITESHVTSLCARGEYTKCYSDQDTILAPFTEEVAKTIADGLPQVALPSPMQILPADSHDVTFSEVKEAFRKLKRGKACGYSGWNRELLFPVLANPPPLIRSAISKMFTDFCNGLITEPEKDLFRSLVVIPLQYKSKPGKVRTVMITDGIVKLCWHILALGITDEKIERSGQVFNKPGQTTLALCAIQACLERGFPVVSLDAVNAFPSLRRESFMDYINKHRQYAKMKAFTNLMYAAPATARWTDSITNAVKEFKVTTGCLQGCVSGPRFYSIGTVDIALKFLGKVVLVADDTHVIGADALTTAPLVIGAFAAIGQKLDGPKMRVWSSPTLNLTDSTLPPILQGAKILTDPTEVLGGFVTPIPSKAHPRLEEFEDLNKKLADFERKTRRILQLPCPKQCKLLILRSLSKSLIYRAQTYFHPRAREFFQKVDEAMLHAVQKVVPSAEARHAIRVFSHIEDGGLGVYPYEIFHPYLQTQMIEQATAFTTKLGLSINVPPTQTSSLMAEWKRNNTLPRGGAVERDGRTYLKSEFQSWLECRPTNRWTRLTDEAFSTQMGIIFHNLKPFAVECVKDQQPFNPGGLTAEDFTHHLVTCAVCTQQGFYARHQAVVNAIRATLRFHGIHSYIPLPTELPLPDASKGGPDLMVLAKTTDAVDVSIAATKNPSQGESIRDALQERFMQKMRKYEKFAERTEYRIVPFVMSIYGLVCKSTRELLESWKAVAQEFSFIHDLYNNVQMNLIRAQHEMIKFVENKAKLLEAKNKWEGTVQ